MGVSSGCDAILLVGKQRYRQDEEPTSPRRLASSSRATKPRRVLGRCWGAGATPCHAVPRQISSQAQLLYQGITSIASQYMPVSNQQPSTTSALPMFRPGVVRLLTSHRARHLRIAAGALALRYQRKPLGVMLAPPAAVPSAWCRFFWWSPTASTSAGQGPANEMRAGKSQSKDGCPMLGGNGVGLGLSEKGEEKGEKKRASYGKAELADAVREPEDKDGGSWRGKANRSSVIAMRASPPRRALGARHPPPLVLVGAREASMGGALMPFSC
ncbi:hypothetical protein TARUN_8911 [Trichoderma arundinaceum]|uniref:Uncharacterized protein n=1 Tax=Trichoderma arundinaceum TaxID=490622 RepID=A0A395NB72_TRIAR|nr:hypothetical protein TARUN_8911 [Trichoderma arundinaceum]